MVSKKKEKVIVGLSGGIHSYVSAYLLMQQGYEVVGLGINFSRVEELSDEYDCFPIKINELSENCKKLGISFYATQADIEYESYVLDLMISAKAVGHRFDPYINGTRLIFDILSDKAKKLKADLIATGHRAKLQYSKSMNKNQILSYPESDGDKSYLLSFIKQHHLENLILPIADIRKDKIQQIFDLTGIALKKSVEYDSNFMNKGKLKDFYEQRIPKTMREEGEITDYEMEISLAPHDGIYLYQIGQSKITDKYGARVERGKSVIRFDYYKKSVELGKLSLLQNHEGCLIVDFNSYFSIDRSRPILGHLRIQGDPNLYKGNIFYKTNDNIFFKFESPYEKTLTTGQYVSLYQAFGENYMLLGGGSLVFDLKEHKEDYDDDSEDNDIDELSAQF